MVRMGALEDIWSVAATIPRVGRGSHVRVGGGAPRPAQPLELWEFEACPFCRKVREGLTELDLDWVCHPTARGSNHRDDAPDFGGRKYFPYLVDPNTGVAMKESEDILDYLFETYGPGRPPLSRRLAPLNTASAMVSSAIRPRGRVTSGAYAEREQPEQRLELYQFEGCPFCRKVRERLHELNLEFLVRTAGKGSQKRPELRARGGKIMVPYLVDPNTDVEMYESDDIVAYLDATYG